MTTTAERCTSYRHEQNCHDLIIFSLPARLYVSQGSSRCVKPIAVLHLTVDGCNSHVDYTNYRINRFEATDTVFDYTYSYNDRRFVLAVWK